MDVSSINLIEISLSILCVGIFISSIELLLNYKIFDKGDLLDWEFASMAYCHKLKILDVFLQVVSAKFIFFGRFLLSGLILLSIYFEYEVSILMVLLSILTFICMYRVPYGTDGSDQMSTIVLVVLTI